MKSLILWCFLLASGPALAKSKSAPPPVAPPVVVAPPVDPLAAQPVVGPEVSFVPPVPNTGTLSNGVSLWVVPNPSLPIFSVVLTVPGGTILDPVRKEGTASLAMELLRRGAGSRDAQTFAEDLERRGLSIETGVAHDGASIVLSGNVEQLAFGLDLVADMVLRPKLSGSELKQVKELSIAGLQQALSEPSWVASRTANALYWGAGHPYGRPVDGTQAGIAKAGVGDVKKWLKQAWVSGGASITASGAVDLATLQPMLEARLGAPWKAKSATALTLPGLTAHRAEPIFIVDAPGSAQTGFYLAFPGLKSGDAKLAAAQVGTIALGGTFTSRLNALLREKKGYTYGVKAAVEPLRHDGTFVVRTRIRTDVTAPALVDLLGELEGIRQGINEEELTKAKGAYRQDIVAAMESVGGAAGVFSDIHEAGLAPETLRTELEKTGRLRVASIKPAMMAYDIAGGVVVLVGDQKVIEPELRKAGFTLIKTVTPP